MKSKALIAGVTGFIGSEFVRQSIKQGCRVVDVKPKVE